MTAAQCTICGQTKPASEFRFSSRFGVRTECKECEQTQLRCGRCKTVKLHKAFAPDKVLITGRKSFCRACEGEHRRKARATDGYRAKQRRRRNLPEVRARESEAYRRWAGASKTVVVEEKACSACGTVKPSAAFGPNKKTSDRLASWCKSCVAKRMSGHRKKPEVKRRIAAYATLPKVKAWRRRYHASPAGKLMAKRYRQSPKGKVAVAAKKARRRARMQDVICTLTGVEWRQILEAHNYKCVYCSRPFGPVLKATMDHKVAIAKGGQHTKENVVPACMHCNCSKKDNDWPTTPPI